MREVLQRLLDRFRRDALDRELAEEIAFHRQQLERDALQEGTSPDDARRTANLRFGNTTVVRELTRERWTIRWVEHLLYDVRYALRGLRRSPIFTTTVVLTLGLGLGASATMFGVVDQLMFRPLAYLNDPASVHRVYWQWRDGGRLVTSQSGPYTRYVDLQREATSFAQLAAFQERMLAVGEGEDVRERRVGLVSASYFSFFDAPAVLGRYFDETEDVTPRGAEVAVLSHAFWQSEFGGRDVRGTMLQVGNVRAQIIGVAPPGFAGVNDANPPTLWIPITTFAGSEGTSDARTYFTHYRWGWVHILVRLKPDVTVEQAVTDATVIFQRQWESEREDRPNLSSASTATPVVAISAVRPGAGPDPGLEARTAFWVLIVALIVLVIVAANVINLLVARALKRQRETAMRLALGAGAGRLIAQSIVESVILAALGAAAALFVARWSQSAVLMLLGATPEGVTRELVDWRSIGVTLAMSLAVGTIIGVMPAVLLGRGDIASALQGGARSGVAHGRRVRGALLVAQSALSAVLLIGAFLFIRSLDRVRDMPMGYDSEQVLIINRVFRGTRPSDDAVKAMTTALVTEAQSLPQVEAAAWVVSAPFISTSNATVFVAGLDSTDHLGTFTYQVSTPEYFRVMGTRIRRGRALDANDRIGMPDAAVISESMARVLWPGSDALGQCFRVRADTTPCITVVGIAEDMVQRDLAGVQRFHFYLSLEQSSRMLGNAMVVRVRGRAVEQAMTIQTALQRVLPANAYLSVRPLGTLVADGQRSWRLGATMFVAFGLLALIVAAIGLYGVIGFDVAQRRHELAVRAALGAGRGTIMRLVLGQSVRLVVAGVTAGIVVALYAGRWVEPLLFQQRAVDPVAYGVVAMLMLTVALVASLLPAKRAAGADPASALRAE